MSSLPTCAHPGCRHAAVERCEECKKVFCVQHIQGGLCDQDTNKENKSASLMMRNGCLIMVGGVALGAIIGIVSTPHTGTYLGLCGGTSMIIGAFVVLAGFLKRR